MRKLWVCKNWDEYLPRDRRKGLRLRFDKDVDPEVRRACLEYIAWLKKYYDFPMRIPIYFKSSRYLSTSERGMCVTYFFEPDEKDCEPYICIAVGDFLDEMKIKGKDNALAEILQQVTANLTYYFQWIKDCEYDEIKSRNQAKYYAKQILYDYAETREHP